MRWPKTEYRSVPMSNAGQDVMRTGRAIGGALGDEAERTTPGPIVSIFRRREATVDDLATALGMTCGAIRLHLATPERDGLVHVVGTRPGPTKREDRLRCCFQVTGRASPR